MISKVRVRVIPQKTEVMHLRDAPKDWKRDPSYVYIGRPSLFGNPYRVGENGTRKEVIEKYRSYATQRFANDATFRKRVTQLAGLILVCYCKPRACHGDVLKELIENGLTSNET